MIRSRAGRGARPALPRGALVVVVALFGLLALVGGRYGFHRDELYFVEGGHHPAWAQPDNPVVVPLLAAGWHSLVGGHLWAFRLVPALVAALTVLVAALSSRALGGRPRHQTAAALATAATSIVTGTGHLFSTSTFDILLTAATLLLLVRALAQPDRLGRWLALGLVAGVALEVKVLLLVVLGCCLLALLVVGPRRPLARPGPWLAALVAALLAAPDLVWQARHGWPMLAISAHIAAGGSVSSAERATVVPLSLLLVGPVLSVVLVVGLVVLARSRPEAAGRPYAWVSLAYLVFLVVVVVTGGKAYYPAGFWPLVLAAGAAPVLDRVQRSRRRRWSAVAVLVVSCAVTEVLSLPLAPVGSWPYRAAVAVDPDAGETVGWDGYVATVRQVAARLPPGQRAGAVILTRNYGEAGALSRARRLSPSDAAALPPVFSGHNAYAEWGPPPDSARSTLVVGRFPAQELSAWFTECRLVARLTSPPGVDNEEAGAPVRLCSPPRQPWSVLWPSVRRLA